MSRSRFTGKQKEHIAKEYLEGKGSSYEIADKYGITYPMVLLWSLIYKKQGKKAFTDRTCNRSYSSEFKVECVKKYISGKMSIDEIVAEYGISSNTTLRRWILRYNANDELKDYNPKREVYMAYTKKTTIEECKEIVKYCLSQNRDYKGSASIYNVSYNQVYSWVKKYDKFGEEGLTDRRGHHKTDDEVDELKKLKRENKRLKHQLEENEMLVQLLKKVKEL